MSGKCTLVSVSLRDSIWQVPPCVSLIQRHYVVSVCVSVPFSDRVWSVSPAVSVIHLLGVVSDPGCQSHLVTGCGKFSRVSFSFSDRVL